jgi:cytochrome c553
MQKNIRALFLMLTGALAAQAASAAPDAAAGQTKAAVCGACHGADGNSVAPEWPKLAGQVPEYIAKQLHDFKAGRRSDQTMSPMAQPLTEQDIADLAAYFAAQKVQPGGAKAEALARGREIYEKGTHRPKVVACVGCHGPQGAGSRDWGKSMAAQPALLAPALGGQQTAYVVKQLKAYKEGTRGNDVGHVMRDIVSHLSEQDMAAVAEYITALRR